MGGVHQRANQLASAAHTDLVEHHLEMILHRMRAYASVDDDFVGLAPLQNELRDPALGRPPEECSVRPAPGIPLAFLVHGTYSAVVTSEAKVLHASEPSPRPPPEMTRMSRHETVPGLRRSRRSTHPQPPDAACSCRVYRAHP